MRTSLQEERFGELIMLKVDQRVANAVVESALKADPGTTSRG